MQSEHELTVLAVGLLDADHVGFVDELARELLEETARAHPMFFAFSSFCTAFEG